MQWTFENTLMEALEMKMIKLSKDEVIISMPVNEKTKQPAGYLHGGASVALAETAASFASYENINPEEKIVFGMEINANHIRSKRDGYVTATAKPFHIGNKTMVWEIKITDEQEKLICISRCTVSVVDKRK